MSKGVFFSPAGIGIKEDDAQAGYRHFQLYVFYPECGSRGKPIVYGMPGPDEPDNLAIGGCIIEDDALNCTRSCGHSWNKCPNEE